mmetsp:Transcript_1638/g.3410  ORF Transcript_1638/g.3410 Transcript_1638/m.3410 type:complete len:264 (-) Transcript_1638:22-813(-)
MVGPSAGGQAPLEVLSLPPPTGVCQRCLGVGFRGPHLQPIHCMNRCPRLHSNVVGASLKLEIVVFEENRECHCSLNDGELVTHAFSGTTTEWQKGKVRGNLVRVETCNFVWIISRPSLHLWVLVGSLPSRWVKFIGVLPQVGAAVKIPGRHKNVRPPQHLDSVFHCGTSLGKCVLCSCPSNQNGRFGIKPKSLDEGITRLLHLDDIVVIGPVLALEDGSDFVLDLLEHSRVGLGKLEECPGQHSGRCLVTGNQHRHHIVTQNH